MRWVKLFSVRSLVGWVETRNPTLIILFLLDGFVGLHYHLTQPTIFWLRVERSVEAEEWINKLDWIPF